VDASHSLKEVFSEASRVSMKVSYSTLVIGQLM